MSKTDSYRKAQYIRRKMAVNSTIRKVKQYAFLGAAALSFAYLSDQCNASTKIDKGVSKVRQGIEYIVEKE